MKNPESAPSAPAGDKKPGAESPQPRSPMQIGAARVLPHERTISIAGLSQRVDYKAMRVLLCLADHAGEIVEKETLFAAVWPDQVIGEDVLPVAIRTLRKALGDEVKAPTFIETIPRRGYRLIAPVKLEQRRTAPRRALLALALSAASVAALSILVLRSPNDSRAIGVSGSELANRAYQRARYLAAGGAADREHAVEELLVALEADPGFALAHAALASLQLARWQACELEPGAAAISATQAAERAVELDPRLASAHRALGVVAFGLEWDPATARRHLGRALELAPNDAETLNWWVQLLVSQRQLDAALESTRRLANLEATAYARDWEAYILNLAGRHRLALERLEDQRRLAGDSAELALQMAATHVWLGRPEEAAEAYRETLKKAGIDPSELLRFERAAAEGTIDALLLFHQERVERGGAGPVERAQLHALLGDDEEALVLLEQAAEERRPDVLFIAAEPAFRRLRGHPGFQRLLQRIGLPTE